MDVKTSGLFYHVFVQTILIHWSETWVITIPMVSVLEGVHVGYYTGLTIMIQKSTRLIEYTYNH